MEFIETPTFTRLVLTLMDDDHYACLQAALALRPDLGKVIPGSGGIRKMRWGCDYSITWQAAGDRIWMLLAYAKTEQDDPSPEQLRPLRILVKEFLI